MRVFLDANVLFSAAKDDGAIRHLLTILARRHDHLCVDAYVIEEARRNLATKFPAALAYLDGLLPTLELVPMTAQAPNAPDYGLPEKDRPVMAAAIRGRCQVLVTGDRTHFGRLYGHRIDGVEVLSPAMLAAKL